MDSLLDYDKDFLRPPWGPYGRDLTLGLVSAVSKFLMQILNKTRVLNLETYLDWVEHRPQGVGLLTVSNHTSTFDDPGLPCAMLPWHFFWTEHSHGKNRWTMCASDICFTNELLRHFFLNGKTLPVERGSGVTQPALGVAARTLASGDWLHIFPEGRVTPDGTVGPFKQGIGKLVCDAKAAAGGRDPVILPYFHSGMARVMPLKRTLPGVGHTVEVAVGQPLDISNITCRCNQQGESQQQVWQDIAAALRDAVLQLEPQVPRNPNQVQERPDVAQWEANYQARRQRRQQQQQQQPPEAALQARHAPEVAFSTQPRVGRLLDVVWETGHHQAELHREPHQECDSQDIAIPEENLWWGAQQQQQEQQQQLSIGLEWSWRLWSSFPGSWLANNSVEH